MLINIDTTSNYPLEINSSFDLKSVRLVILDCKYLFK